MAEHAKLLPSDVLLGRLQVHEYRAWARCWAESLEGMFAERQPDESFRSFADLTHSSEAAVREVHQRARTVDAFLDGMAAHWAAAETSEGYRKCRLPDGILCV